jgi:hypothetical protein
MNADLKELVERLRRHECAAREAAAALEAQARTIKGLHGALELVLPLAKGYAPPDQTVTAKATCRSWIAAAEAALALAEPKS